jgi:hypothetical protein
MGRQNVSSHAWLLRMKGTLHAQKREVLSQVLAHEQSEPRYRVQLVASGQKWQTWLPGELWLRSIRSSCRFFDSALRQAMAAVT